MSLRPEPEPEPGPPPDSPPGYDDGLSLRAQPRRRVSAAELFPPALYDDADAPASQDSLPAYDQDRFVRDHSCTLHVTTQGRLKAEVVVLDHATGQLLFKPQHAPRRWALQVLPITTLLTDQAGVACLSLIHGPRIMDFTARSPLDASLVFRMTATDMLNQGAHVRCGPHQRHRCLSVQRTAVYGQWVVRAHPSDRVIAQLDKDPGLRRSLRVKVMAGESTLLMAAIALAIREPCYYDARLPGPLMPYT